MLFLDNEEFRLTQLEAICTPDNWRERPQLLEDAGIADKLSFGWLSLRFRKDNGKLTIASLDTLTCDECQGVE